MMKSGLVSATFRQLTTTDVVNAAREAGLLTIEWSSDIHVPPGDRETAKKVRALCDANHIAAAGYASYYRLGESDSPAAEFKKLLDCAEDLGARTIRIWAGSRGTGGMGPEMLQSMYREAAFLCGLAREAGITLSFEYHPDTLTDTPASTLDLLRAVPPAKTHWQIPPYGCEADNLRDIRAFGGRISNIHVQNYHHSQYFPLKEQENEWKHYLSLLSTLPVSPCLCLEFVKDNSMEQFMEDARMLNRWIKEVTEPWT